MQLYNEDCLSGMSRIDDKSVDMILCDLPYGVTNCKWDSQIIPFAPLWEQYSRIIKDNGAIVLFAAQPFTTQVINSNRKLFRYCWYWVKNNVTGFTFAKYQPMRKVEDICVFYKRPPTYNPQGLRKLEKPREKIRAAHDDCVYKMSTLSNPHKQEYTGYPNNVLYFDSDSINGRGSYHPTQKPVKLCEYLIGTYTNEGEVVLDNCMGSGTTGVACANIGRKFIGFELDSIYFARALKRIEESKLGKFLQFLKERAMMYSALATA